jgi:hypothetical protein
MTHYREDLDAAKCDTPGCKCISGPVLLRPNCHPEAGFYGRYFRSTGMLELRCRQCNKLLVSFAIASRLPAERN